MDKVIRWPEGPAWRQQVTIENRVYIMRAYWNTVGEFWVFSLATANDEPILSGVKVVQNVDFFDRSTDERLPSGSLLLVTNLSCGCTPGRNDLDDNARLLYVSAI
jgi:hypothetical protein